MMETPGIRKRCSKDDEMPRRTYTQLIQEVSKYLESEKSFDSDNSKTNKQIIEVIRKKIDSGELNIDVTNGTILAYLSFAANKDEDSAIVSGRSHGGYWLDLKNEEQDASLPPDEQDIESTKGEPVRITEKDLYPLMELWLEQKGYKSKDISTLKRGKKWGNPDIVGVSRVELFGAVEIELASCEIKLSEDNWERMIFEAISHKRFTNRSWFCYRVDKPDLPIPKGMKYYAERYRVGLVQIVLSNDDLISLKNQKDSLDFINKIIEHVPAGYDRVPLTEQKELAERTEMNITITF